MKKKFLLIIALFIGLLSVFSIGFASWIVTKPLVPVTEEDVINTIVYETYDNAKYIEILDSTVLQYYRTGFVEDNNITITDTGKITINFKLNVQDYKDYLTSKNLSHEQITIDLKLRHANNSTGVNFFNDSSLYEISYVVKGLTGSDIVGPGSNAQFTLSTLPNAEEVEFSVTFMIKYKGEKFKTDVFEKVDGVRFAVEARMIKE